MLAGRGVFPNQIGMAVAVNVTHTGKTPRGRGAVQHGTSIDGGIFDKPDGNLAGLGVTPD
jgi:hypothetical protein